MILLAWIGIGVVAGVTSNRLAYSTGQGLFMDLVLGHTVLMDVLIGIVGAVLGGWIFRSYCIVGAAVSPIYELGLSVLVATLFLCAYHSLKGCSR